MNWHIRKAFESDMQAITNIVVTAFGDVLRQEIADLSKDRSLTFIRISFVMIIILMTIISPVWGDATLRFSNYLPIEDSVSKALNVTVREIAAKTNGEIKIKIYPSSQLFESAENFDAVADGSIDMAFARLYEEDDRVPVFGVLGLPYAFYSLKAVMDHCRGGLDNFLDKEANTMGVKIVCVGFIDYVQCFYKNKPLLKPTDYKNVRLGIPSENIAIAIKTLGGISIMIPTSDIYKALQRDVVDGHMGTIDLTIQEKLYDFEKYGFISPLGIRPVHVIASLNTWNKLSSTQQKIIKQSFDEMADNWLAVFRKNILGDSLRRLKQHGMKIHIQSAEEMDPLRYAVTPLYDEYFKKAGKKGKQTMNMILFNPFKPKIIP